MPDDLTTPPSAPRPVPFAAVPQARAAPPAPVPHRPDGAAGPGIVPDFRTFDRLLRAMQARATQGISPVAIARTWSDWCTQLGTAPGRQLALVMRAWIALARYAMWLPKAAAEAGPQPPSPDADRRFADPAWSNWPFNAIAEGYRTAEAWWLEDHARCARHDARAPERDRLHDAPTGGCLGAEQHPLAQPGDHPAHGAGGRLQPAARHAELAGRPGPPARRQAAGGNRGVPGRPRRRDHPRPRGVSQPADRADPVRAHHRDRACRAGADRARVDHEVLHPRPDAGELAGPLAGRPGAHRLHGVMEEPRWARPRHQPRRLSA